MEAINRFRELFLEVWKEGVFGLNASDYLLGVMGSDADGIILTREYLDIIFYGTFIVLIQISLNGTLNAQGDTKSYRNILIFSFFLNIILNPILITGKIINFELFEPMGITGIAIATIISQIIGLLYLLYKIYRTEIFENFKRNYLIPKLSFCTL